MARFSSAIPQKELLLSSQHLNCCKDEICPNFCAKAYTKSCCYVTTVCLKMWNIRSTFNSILLKVPEISPYYLDLGCQFTKISKWKHHNENMIRHHDENSIRIFLSCTPFALATSLGHVSQNRSTKTYSTCIQGVAFS